MGRWLLHRAHIPSSDCERGGWAFFSNRGRGYDVSFDTPSCVLDYLPYVAEDMNSANDGPFLRLCPMLNGTMKAEDGAGGGDSSFGAAPAPLIL